MGLLVVKKLTFERSVWSVGLHYSIKIILLKVCVTLYIKKKETFERSVWSVGRQVVQKLAYERTV